MQRALKFVDFWKSLHKQRVHKVKQDVQPKTNHKLNIEIKTKRNKTQKLIQF